MAAFCLYLFDIQREIIRSHLKGLMGRKRMGKISDFFDRMAKKLYFCSPKAVIAQLVERQLPKLQVAGSRPVYRSNIRQRLASPSQGVSVCGRFPPTPNQPQWGGDFRQSSRKIEKWVYFFHFFLTFAPWYSSKTTNPAFQEAKAIWPLSLRGRIG